MLWKLSSFLPQNPPNPFNLFLGFHGNLFGKHESKSWTHVLAESKGWKLWTETSWERYLKVFDIFCLKSSLISCNGSVKTETYRIFFFYFIEGKHHFPPKFVDAQIKHVRTPTPAAKFFPGEDISKCSHSEKCKWNKQRVWQYRNPKQPLLGKPESLCVASPEIFSFSPRDVVECRQLSGGDFDPL